MVWPITAQACYGGSLGKSMNARELTAFIKVHGEASRFRWLTLSWKIIMRTSHGEKLLRLRESISSVDVRASLRVSICSLDVMHRCAFGRPRAMWSAAQFTLDGRGRAPLHRQEW